MKNCEIRLLVILLCCVCIFGCERAQKVVKPPVAVDLIPDPNLAAAVREELGLTTDDILTAEVLQNLRILIAQDRQIVDLTGLEYAVNLTKLPLVENQISDIAPLAANSGLGTGDFLSLQGNPLDEAAVRIHIPALQKRGVRVIQ